MAKVLIVDDSRTSRRILRNLLEEAGHEVVAEALNGDEGYLKYKELNPDIVTMDITMPVTDGLQALQLIRHYDGNAKVVMITAAGQKDKMVQALKEGASDFITKPFDKEDVIVTINKMAEK